MRAALAILEPADGELPVRIGIEAGEVVVEDGDSTFATGEAVNVAARLQQAAEPGEILIGPDRVRARRRIASSRERARRAAAQGPRASGIEVWRVVCTERPTGRPLNVVGAVRRPRGGARAAREHVRARRARPARPARHDLRRARGRQEPARARVLRGPRAHDRPHRALAAVRRGHRLLAARRDGPGGGRDLADDDSPEEAIEKLREACSSDAVADLLGLAVRRARHRVGRARRGRRSPGPRTNGRRASPRRSRSCSSSRTSTGPRSRCST